jgi:hypothetical protein
MAATKAKPEKRSLGLWGLHGVRFWSLLLKATWGLFGEGRRTSGLEVWCTVDSK